MNAIEKRKQVNNLMKKLSITQNEACILLGYSTSDPDLTVNRDLPEGFEQLFNGFKK